MYGGMEALEGVFNITKKHICAGNKNGIDSCHGDSGGPLVCLVDKEVLVVGIVSYGIGCADKSGIPGVYTNVAKYHDWITNLMVRRHLEVAFKKLSLFYFRIKMMLRRHINLQLKAHKLHHHQMDVQSQNGKEMDIVMMGIIIHVVIMMVEIAAQIQDLYTADYVNARIQAILQ